MALKKFDEKIFLQADEKTLYKAYGKKSAWLVVEMILCYVFWILSLSGGCFVVSAGIGMKQYDTVESGYILVVALLLFVNLVPFGFWIAHVFKDMPTRSDRWYVLTDRRLLVVTDNKPSTVTFLNLDEVTEVTAGKNVITVIAGEKKLKIKGILDVTAFLNRLEIVVFGDDDEQDELNSDLKNSEADVTDDGEPEVWIE